MLISNVKSLADLERKKQLQQQLLQVMIDNEELLEKRILSYGPNLYKDQPPPVPPQYRTESEIQKDVNAQIAKAKENLLSIPDIDINVVQSILPQIGNMEGGADNYLKLNKYFPTLKSQISKKYSAERLDSVFLLSLIGDLFSNIDEDIFLNKLKATTVSLPDFGVNPLKIPSKEDYEGLISQLNEILSLNPSEEIEIRPYINRLEKFKEASMTKDEQLKFIDDEEISRVQKSSVNRIITELLSGKSAALSNNETKMLKDVMKNMVIVASKQNTAELEEQLSPEDEALLQQEYKKFYKYISKYINQPNDAVINKMKKLKDDIIAKEVKLEKESGEKAEKAVKEIKIGVEKKLEEKEEKKKAIMTLAEKAGEVQGDLKKIIERLKAYSSFYPKDKYGIFIDSAPNNTNTLINDTNLPKIQRVIEYAIPASVIKDKQVFIEEPDSNGNFKSKKYAKYIWAVIKTPVYVSEGISYNHKLIPRYKSFPLFMKDEIDEIEQRMIDEYPEFNPIKNIEQRVVKSQGFGVKQPMMLPQVIDPMTGRRKMPPSMQPEIEMLKGEGFMHRKIKIGRGIEALEAEPRFKTFGKYIINTLQLDKNILNLRFPSTGPIPAIKPVHIDDNFKEFILDILESGKVNQKHYDSLTEAEKAHFNKIIRGAKLTDVLKFKADEKIDDKKDLKRLEVLYGEVLAGNDNDKVIRECKSLIKKCVSNGQITKIKGMDMLMEMGNI